ncbi:MAG: benzylsuccinate synthase gamma subunit family protein [Desulfosudaceae bacterium]
MAACNECKHFFPLAEQPENGDCVKRGEDPRQAFYMAKPVAAEQDAASCPDFQKK